MADSGLVRSLKLPQATALVVGTILGASVFVQASELTEHVPRIWAVLLAWLLLRGVWFLLVTLPRRAWRKHQANLGYERLIDHLVTTTVDDQYARRIDGPVKP